MRRPLCRCVITAALLIIVSPAISAIGQAPATPASGVRDLLTAARRGDLAGIARALAAGADVNGTDPTFQQTALMRAAMFGQAQAVEALLRARASPAGASNLQRTALHWAAIGGSAEAVRLLLKAGAVVDAADADTETPLGLAMGEGRLSATEVLLSAGADANRAYRSIAYDLSLVLGNRETGDRRDTLRAVIRRGKGLERDDSRGRTALLVAAAWAHQDGSAEIARELLGAGARPEAKNFEGRTAAEDVRARLPRERDPAYKANMELMLEVLTRGGRR